MRHARNAAKADDNQGAIVKVGAIFGRWTVLGRGANIGGRRSGWLCRCSCGTERLVMGQSLRNGGSLSCGCLQKEIVANMCRSRTVHGNSKRSGETRIYRIWRHMLERCNNPSCLGFKWWGGKGVRVCAEWLEFSVFLDWANSSGYESNLSIDRINSNGNYEPKNCRWITRSENSRRANEERWGKKRMEVAQ